MKINMPWARFFKSRTTQPAPSPLLPSARQETEDALLSPPSRKLHVYCDGGFANRFNALVSGIVLAERCGLDPEVVWPLNDRCAARFADLFDLGIPVVERDRGPFLAESAAYQLFVVDAALQQTLAAQSPLEFSSEATLIEAILASDKPVFLSTPLIPACLSLDDVMRVIRRLQFKPALTAPAQAFIAEHFPGPFYGLQICKSESGSQEVDEGKLFALVESLPMHRFFVCADESAVEKRFGALPNVAVYPQTASAIDAAIALLILSHSQVVRTTGSSILTLALLLQAARKPEQASPLVSEPVTQQLVDETAFAPALRPEVLLPGKMGLPLFETLREMGLPAPNGVLQVGASYGQQMQYFLQNGIRRGLFIEPLQTPYSYLAGICRQLPGFIAVQALCAEDSGQEHSFYLASDGGVSSSLLKPSGYLQTHEHVKFQETVQMVSNTLDGVMEFAKAYGHTETLASLDTLFIDTQGSELSIMLGGTRTLRQINYIYTAVMRAELFEGQPSFQSVCAWLEVMGFTLNNAYFGTNHSGYALFVRKSLLGL